jgi:hypothetical protein
MGIKSKFLAVITALTLLSGVSVVSAVPATAASVKVAAGAKCSVAKKQVKVAKSSLVCKKNAKGKLVWTKTAAVRATPKANPVAAAKIQPLTIVEEPQSASAAPADTASPADVPQSPSGYPVVIDPNAGGSPEVVIRTPEESEVPAPSNPVAPANLRVTQLGDDAVTVTHDLVEGVSQYQVYLRYGDSFTAKGTDSSNLTVEFTELTPDWDYVVCAYYRVNNVDSNKSCINVHTTGERPVQPVQPNGPASISLISTETTISATWTVVAGATGYSLCHVRVDSWQCGGYTMLSETSAIFQDGSIFAGWRYGIQVTAVFADGTRSLPSISFINSKGSQPPAPTKYAAPTNLRIVDLTPTSVTIAWDDPANSPVTLWSVVTRFLTSYSQTGVDPNARQFTSTAIWPGGGFEIILSGFDQVNGKWTAQTRIGFFAPNAN